jgi:hypothetical protein
MTKLMICLLTISFSISSLAQTAPKNFERMILNTNKVNDWTLSLIINQLDSGKLVTWTTLEYAIEKLDTIKKKIAFIDALFKYDYWEDEMRLKLARKKLFYYRNCGEEINSRTADSLLVSTSLAHYSLFKAHYYQTLRDYTTLHNEMGRSYLKTLWKIDKADESYIEVLKVPFYEIRDEKTMYHIRELHMQAIIGRLDAARGNAFKLKNILIPYPLEQYAFRYAELTQS